MVSSIFIHKTKVIFSYSPCIATIAGDLFGHYFGRNWEIFSPTRFPLLVWRKNEVIFWIEFIFVSASVLMCVSNLFGENFSRWKGKNVFTDDSCFKLFMVLLNGCKVIPSAFGDVIRSDVKQNYSSIARFERHVEY